MIRLKDEGAAVRDELDELIDRACEADPLPHWDDEPEPPRGDPLSKAACHDAQRELATLQAPARFIAHTNALRCRCAPEDFFSRPFLKFLHDAYVLAKFVERTPVDKVRLARADEQWPDGYVTRAGKTHNIEITSTHAGSMRPERTACDFSGGSVRHCTYVFGVSMSETKTG